VASELVNDLNAKKRMVAGFDDLEVAVEKVTVSAQAYFFYTWQEDCSDAEREVLRALARGEAQGLDVAQDPQVLQRLWQKEIVEQVDHRYRFTIELFRRWIMRSQLHLEPSTRADDRRASR
jgi:hypothetical protein